MITDPISDLLTRIRNAGQARHAAVTVPNSKMRQRVLDILKSEGFISDYEVMRSDVQGSIAITLKYLPNRESAITGLRRISKPGCRRYVKSDEIPKILNGLGIAIVSTSHGVMTDRQARRQKVGGELLCAVW